MSKEMSALLPVHLSFKLSLVRTVLLIVLILVAVLFCMDVGAIATVSTTLERPMLVEKSEFLDVQRGQSNHRTGNASLPVDLNISIVVQLSGEMGNHLSKLAFGFSIQQVLWEQYGIASHLILRRQEEVAKAVWARKDVQACFPNFRNQDFEAGNTGEFQQRLEQQQRWLGQKNASKLVLESGISEDEVDGRLSYLHELLLQAKREPKNSLSQQALAVPNKDSKITLPFIYTQSFVRWEYIERYYNRLRSLFAFDDEACCASVPQPDEHVFVRTIYCDDFMTTPHTFSTSVRFSPTLICVCMQHFRNYVAEMPNYAKPLAFEELSPNQTVLELFEQKPSSARNYSNENGGTSKKIVITTRIHNEEARTYVEAFQRFGWNARIEDHRTGTQAFCFLRQTKQDLVGFVRSTFLIWASLLGNSSQVRLYSINTTKSRSVLGANNAYFIGYKWKRPELRNRFRFVTITPKDTMLGG